MSIVLLGSTSGSCTLQEQAVAGTSVLTLPVGTGTVVANNVNSAIVSGTAVASTSGTSVDFTSIPSWVKKITVMLSGVSTNGTSNYQIQIGDSGGVETTGYGGSSSAVSGGTAAGQVYAGAGFTLFGTYAAAGTYSGYITISLLDSSTNTWNAFGSLARTDSVYSIYTTGSKSLSATLDRVRITTVNGTDTFDAGTINILYE
jgi:hypothetical protein